MRHSRFCSSTNEWETPESIFRPLDREFKFELDVCATKLNRKVPKFISPAEDSLKQKWAGVCWLNPPYGFQIRKWIKKAYESSLEGSTVVCLLPVRSNTNYWHDYCMRGEIRFIKGYPRFGNCKQGLKMPLAIVIFRNTKIEGKGMTVLQEEVLNLRIQQDVDKIQSLEALLEEAMKAFELLLVPHEKTGSQIISEILQKLNSVKEKK